MGRVLSPVLVGRHEEVAELRAVLREARANRGGLVAVVGEPGVGKSRLAREAQAVAVELGLTSFAGRATPDGGPLRALTSAFLAYGRRHRIPGTPELEPFRAALGGVVPDWATGGPKSAPSTPLVGEGLLRLLRVLAPRGALLVLEDLHWADPETLAVLDYLADGLAGEPVAVLVTARSDERSPAGEWLATACSRRVARRVDLLRLPAAQSLELARACLAAQALPAELESFLAEQAEGLPLLVEDLLAELVSSAVLVRRGGTWAVTGPLRADVPRTFATTVHRRLAALDEGARRVVSAAAVLGRRFDAELLAAVTGCDEEAVVAALRAAVEHQIVTSDESGPFPGFRFRHALTRDVVLGLLLPPERVALARAAADVVELRHPGLPGEWCALAATLHATAGRRHRAAELLLQLGRRALASGALASAEAVLRRARAVVDDPALADAVEVALTEALALAGRVDEALAVGEAVLARLARGHDTGAEAAVRLRLARAAATAGQEERARTHLDAVLRSPADEEQRIRAEALCALVAVGAGALTEAEDRGVAVLPRAERAQLWDVVCETLQVIGRCARARDPAEAERLFERAYRAADEHGLVLERIRTLHELGTIDLFETGRSDRLTSARQLAAESGALVTAAYIDLHLGLLLSHAGQADAGRRALEDCLTAATRLRLPVLRRVALAQLGYVLALAGRRSDAEARLAEVAAEPSHDDARLLAAGLARPFLLLLDEDRTAAVAALDQVAPDLPHGAWPQWGLRALLRAVGGLEPARALAEAECAAEPGRPIRLNQAYLGFARAVLAGRAGNPRAAAEAFAEADEHLGWQAAHRPFVWRQVAEAALVDRWGEPVRWLREALPAFEAIGARPAVAACRSLLERSGVPVPRRGRGDAAVPAALAGFGVTSREVDVLALVVRGASNPEIAARLHLSRRTVETHVAQLLAKTGVSRREDLRRFADSVSPPP